MFAKDQVMREIVRLAREGEIEPDPEREAVWYAVDPSLVRRRLARAHRPRRLEAEERAVVEEAARDLGADERAIGDLVREGVLRVEGGSLTYSTIDGPEIERRIGVRP